MCVPGALRLEEDIGAPGSGVMMVIVIWVVGTKPWSSGGAARDLIS